MLIHPDGYYKEIYEVTDDSIKHGTYLKYYSNEILADSCEYQNGKIHGERKLYSEEGKLEIVESYEHGVFEGPYTTYYPGGQIKKIQQYKSDKIQGILEEYYENGKLKAEVTFRDNLENGPFKEYHENGQLHWEGFYANGDYEQDTLKEYNLEGLLVRKLYCDKGICQTVWTPDKGYVETKKIFGN